MQDLKIPLPWPWCWGFLCPVALKARILVPCWSLHTVLWFVMIHSQVWIKSHFKKSSRSNITYISEKKNTSFTKQWTTSTAVIRDSLPRTSISLAKENYQVKNKNQILALLPKLKQKKIMLGLWLVLPYKSVYCFLIVQNSLPHLIIFALGCSWYQAYCKYVLVEQIAAESLVYLTQIY